MFKILDFYAEWCGPCKIMAPIFEELEKEYSAKPELKGNIEFKRIDVDEDGESAARFDVQSIPTFVILKDDKFIDRKIGAMPKEAIKKWIESSIK